MIEEQLIYAFVVATFFTFSRAENISSEVVDTDHINDIFNNELI